MNRDKLRRIKQQKIVSLKELAEMAWKNGKHLIFDMREPPFGVQHPYRARYMQLIVKTLKDSKLDDEKIWWISGHQYPYVLKTAPKFRQVLIWFAGHFWYEFLVRLQIY